MRIWFSGDDGVAAIKHRYLWWSLDFQDLRTGFIIQHDSHRTAVWTLMDFLNVSHKRKMRLINSGQLTVGFMYLPYRLRTNNPILSRTLPCSTRLYNADSPPGRENEHWMKSDSRKSSTVPTFNNHSSVSAACISRLKFGRKSTLGSSSPLKQKIDFMTLISQLLLRALTKNIQRRRSRAIFSLLSWSRSKQTSTVIFKILLISEACKSFRSAVLKCPQRGTEKTR